MTNHTLRKAGKLAALVAAGAVVLSLLLVGSALTVARTSWGAERLRRVALPRVNAALAGAIDVRHFRFLGDRVHLEGVSLKDPEGALVAQVARVEVAFAPWQLLRRHLSLRTVIIDAPLLLLRQERSGETNLARALAAKHPGPAPRPATDTGGKEQGSPLSVEVDNLQLSDGTVDWKDERPIAPPVSRHVRLEQLAARGSARYGGGADGPFGVSLELRGEAAAPLKAPVELILESKGASQVTVPPSSGGDGTAELAAEGRVSLSIGESTVQLSGDLQALPPRQQLTPPTDRGSARDKTAPPPPFPFKARVTIERVRVTPQLLRLLSPTSPLKSALTMSGKATLDGASGKVSSELHLAGAGAAVTVTAAVDLARRSMDGLTVRARDIDLARLLKEGSPSNLSFDLDAHGEGHDLATLRGAATLRVPPGRLGGYALGPIRLRADADRGRYKFADLLAVIPGVNVTGGGEATAKNVAFRMAVDVRDLSATVRSLTSGSAKGSPHASGRGRIEVALDGKPQAPSLHVKGHLVGLGWQDIRVPVLDIQADLPDVRVPLAASVNLNVPRADVGSRHFRGLVVKLRADSPRFDASLELTAPEQLTLNVAGVWGIGHQEIGFQEVSLRSRRATWRSTKPMRLVFGGEALRVIGLDWRTTDGQHLRLDLDKRSSTVRADVRVAALDLAKLPESILPPTLQLAGRLDADVQVRGRPEQPAVDAQVTLAEGRVGPVRDIALSTKMKVSGRRLVGDLDVGALGAKVAGTFDLPMLWPPPPEAPLLADLRATNIDFQRVLTGLKGARDQVAPGATKQVVVVAAKRPLDLRGSASWNLKVSGRGAAPQVALNAEVRQLQVNGSSAGNVSLQIDAPGNRPITARVELGQLSVATARTGAKPGAAAGPGEQPQAADASTVTVRTGFSLGTLIHHPPSTKAVLATPLHVEARVRGVKLAPLAVLAGYVGKVGGTASLDADLDGTPQTARGKLALTISGASAGRFPPTDASLSVDMGERDVRADASISRRGSRLFSLGARIDAPVARFIRPEKADLFADVPIELHAVLGSIELQRVGLPPETDRQPARILKGRLRAQADVTGTLRAPRVSTRTDLNNLRLDQTPIGSAVVLANYANRTVDGDVTLVSGNGGRLHLIASAQVDLGYPAITRGLDPEKIPVKARLNAKGFDLAGFSGATAGLRTVAGQLFAGVDVTGTAADPRVGGTLEWKDGGLTVTGMGEYKRIHLLAHGDKEHIVLDELRAESGGGRARVTASGDHRDGQGYAIKAALDLDKFPAYVEGQALAALSLEAKADTQVSVQRVRAKVSINSARLALSDAKRKHLQKLAPPADVVLIDGEAPINQAQARKFAAVTAALAPPEEKEAKVAAASGRPADDKPAGVIIFVDAPRNLWVSGKDANVELGLQPGFRVEMTEVTRVYGQVVIKRGRVDVVGRRFDLKADSTTRFAGPPDRPELDVAAKHENEQERITVLVTVKGSPGHLQIGITAPDRPDLTETQLYTLIVTGRLTFGGGTASSATPTDRAASLVGGLVAAQLQKSLSKKLPFDVLTIEAGNGLGAARLEAGTYLTSELYVGYVGRLGADPALLQNRNAVHLEYELGAHWSFQGEYGDAKTGSADMMWTKRY